MALSKIFDFHLGEYIAMIRVGLQARNIKMNIADDQEDLKFCYEVLKDVSRSFAAVIMQLNPELRDAVCLFYLVLRALDTVEDDMDVSVAEKKKCLPVFHENLNNLEWCIQGIGKGMERTLLEQFYRVSKECKKLRPEYQEVISDICHKMALGMCHYLENVVVTKDDYNMYCHYVAGLVGQGLSRLFASSGLEDPSIARDLDKANEMGLFLQKTNIIRDYYEDIIESPPRIFWPKDIWSHFGESMHDFKDPANRSRAMECLHAMIADAMTHIPACVEYLAALKEPSVFLFCAIPQVMAIATLAKLYNNERVFCDKVKIRKGLACKIILCSNNMQSAMTQFLVHIDELEKALLEEDPSYDVSKQRLAQARACIAQYRDVKLTQSYARNFLTHYPALGGRLLYAIVDNVTGYFRADAATH